MFNLGQVLRARLRTTTTHSQTVEVNSLLPPIFITKQVVVLDRTTAWLLQPSLYN